MNQDKAYNLYGLGREAAERGDLAEAEHYLRESLRRAPHFKTFHVLAGVCAQKGNLEEALNLLRQAHEANPGNDRVAIDLAIRLLDSGDEQEAGRIVDSVLQRNETYGPARELKRRLSGEM
jgi:thioredoxin-like negative regulator of GroEL